MYFSCIFRHSKNKNENSFKKEHKAVENHRKSSVKSEKNKTPVHKPRRRREKVFGGEKKRRSLFATRPEVNEFNRKPKKKSSIETKISSIPEQANKKRIQRADMRDIKNSALTWVWTKKKFVRALPEAERKQRGGNPFNPLEPVG